MGNANASEFVAVEMKFRHIRVTWNVGGGPQTIQHSTKLRLNRQEGSEHTLTDDKKWWAFLF